MKRAAIVADFLTGAPERLATRRATGRGRPQVRICTTYRTANACALGLVAAINSMRIPKAAHFSSPSLSAHV